MQYELIDSGNLEKCERFGDIVLSRPCPQALWEKQSQWKCDAIFSSETRSWNHSLDPWHVTIDEMKLKLELTSFGHLGLFPEHTSSAKWLLERKAKNVLNLFAYSGFLSLKLGKVAQVTHVDSSKPAIEWAKENAHMNKIDSIRWICEDAMRFCKKEQKRNKTYDGILLDPPTFGRGAKNELFKIEEHLMPLLKLLKQLLSEDAKFFYISCHTPNLNGFVLKKCLEQIGFKDVECGALFLPNSNVPAGDFARWTSC